MGTTGRAVFYCLRRAHAGQRPLRIFCRRVVLPGLQPSSRLGFCGPTAAHFGDHLARTRDARRYAARAPFFAGGGGGVSRALHRADCARTGRAAIWDGIGVRVRNASANLSGARFAANDECVRIPLLDGRRADCSKNFQRSESEAMVAVRRGLWSWPAEQALDDVFRPGTVSGLVADEPEEAVAGALAVARRADCSPHFPAEPLLGGGPALSPDSTFSHHARPATGARPGAA